MDSYREMYYKLFNKITDAIGVLKAAQAEAEELLLSQEEEQAAPPAPAENGKTD